jgi:mRNA interferase RelE/StbE
MYKIDYSKQARKTLKAMPQTVAGRIMDKVDTLGKDFFAPHPGVKKLVNRPGYRLRVGDWRVVYTVHEDILRIAVVRIASRGQVYQ